MNVRIMPHKVQLTWRDEVPQERQNATDALEWANAHAGVCDMDTGDWNVTHWYDSFCNMDIYRFMDSKTAVMFKLMWGGM